MLEGRTQRAREYREQIDTWWAKRLNIPHLTPRWVLQNWGTDVLRNAFHQDIWIASLENKLRKTRDDIVISDCRFPNEILAIKNQGGIVIRVIRGDEPAWMTAAKNYMSGPSTIGWAIGKDVLNKAGIHASEYSWVATEFDAVIDNNGTIDNLYKQVGLLVHPEDQKLVI